MSPRPTLPRPATVADLARYVAELEAFHGWTEADCARTCFLMGEEVGELFGAVRSLERVADPDRRKDAIEHVGEEIVDVLNYLLALANRLDLDVEQAFVDKNTRNLDRSWAD